MLIRIRYMLLLWLGLVAALQASGQMNMPDTVCQGELKHYWVDPTPGSVYTWRINGMLQLSTTNEIWVTWDGTYPSAGSPYTITVQELGTNGCFGPVRSGNVEVIDALAVSVGITADKNPFCPGNTVTFTASSVNGGKSPVYLWTVNSVPQPVNGPSFAYTPVAGDLVRCDMTSSYLCATGNPAISNSILMIASPVPYAGLTLCNTLTTRDARPFTLKGGIPAGGIYSGTGVSGDQFNPAMVPLTQDTAIIRYTQSNSYGCRSSAQGVINIYPAVPFICGSNFTDIRDARTYRTIQIASQCWMAENLNYGSQIQASVFQLDNCTAEKYCFNDDPANCTSNGGLYEWDELMEFGDFQTIQGICPPAWHIPDESEWNTLFAVFGGNGFAGDQLRAGGPSGFNGVLTGARFGDVRWAPDTTAFYWSSTSHGPIKAWAHSLNSINHGMSYYPSSRANAFSVRCVKD